MMCARDRSRPEVLSDEATRALVKILEPGDGAGEILTGQKGVCFQAEFVAFRFGPGTPAVRSQPLLPVEFIEQLRDGLDFLAFHEVGVLSRRLPPFPCLSVPL